MRAVARGRGSLVEGDDGRFMLMGCGEGRLAEQRAAEAQLGSVEGCEEVIADVGAPDARVLEALGKLLRLAGERVGADFWRGIENDGRYSGVRRRWALVQLLGQYVQPGATLGPCGAVLSAKWLRVEQVSFVTEFSKGGAGGRPPYPWVVRPGNRW